MEGPVEGEGDVSMGIPSVCAAVEDVGTCSTGRDGAGTEGRGVGEEIKVTGEGPMGVGT